MDLLNVLNICRQEEAGFMLKDISFTQAQHERIAIAGESGSGKSTLLRIIAGLKQADSGTAAINGERLKGPDEQLIPGHKHIAYLSQHYELRNHYRMEELLQMANKLPPEKAQRIYEVCRIDHLVKRKMKELSGGERQRIAFAIALCAEPKLLVLDEPFSNLDLIHKGVLKQVMDDAASELSMTLLIASHEPEDILPWADRILVLKDGRIAQQGAAEDIYRQPVNEYVAGLFGKYNLLPAGLMQHARPQAGEIIVRPEQIRISDDEGYPAVVAGCRFYGSHYETELKLETLPGPVLSYTSQAFQKGTSVCVRIK